MSLNNPFPRVESQTAQSAEEVLAGEASISISLAGGQRLVRSAIFEMLQSSGLGNCRLFEDELELTTFLTSVETLPMSVMVLILMGGATKSAPFVKQVLEKTSMMPLVVLSDQVTRGQIYAALRMGAKAFIGLNSEPKELLAAITMASQHKVYLSPDAAELLISDISGSFDASHTSRSSGGILSKREVEIVQLLCEGCSSKEIAHSLHLSTKTVENHRYNIYRKCEVESIAGLIRHAIQHGMISI